MSAADVLTAGEPQPTPAETLAGLLQLPSVGLSITRAIIHGHGSRASADVFLSDGTIVQFESLRDFANASKLAVEVTATTGATPRLKAPDAQNALALLRALATHEEVMDADDVSRDLGVQFLQSAEVLDLDMNDQAQRWGAFSYLSEIDPGETARCEGRAYARCCTVLRDLSGNRYVRCGWFWGHARDLDRGVSQAELAHRMERVGWGRRGSRGAIKATSPARDASLIWTFYLVPKGWSDTASNEAPGCRVVASSHSRAHVNQATASRVGETTGDNPPRRLA